MTGRRSATSSRTAAATCRPSAPAGATSRSTRSSRTRRRWSRRTRVAARAEPVAIPWTRGRFASWLVTTDHKRIGIMYISATLVFFAAGGIMALLMRTQLAQPDEHFITGNAYNQLFTMHGTTMIFLVIVPIMAGFGNFLVPLMIGAKDMAFPRLNALSYWLFLMG